MTAVAVASALRSSPGAVARAGGKLTGASDAARARTCNASSAWANRATVAISRWVNSRAIPRCSGYSAIPALAASASLCAAQLVASCGALLARWYGDVRAQAIVPRITAVRLDLGYAIAG